jgi:hypothetical protein
MEFGSSLVYCRIFLFHNMSSLNVIFKRFVSMWGPKFCPNNLLFQINLGLPPSWQNMVILVASYFQPKVHFCAKLKWLAKSDCIRVAKYCIIVTFHMKQKLKFFLLVMFQVVMRYVMIIKMRWHASYISGLYYKNILTIISEDRKLCLYYKCFISPNLSLSWCHQLRP